MKSHHIARIVLFAAQCALACGSEQSGAAANGGSAGSGGSSPVTKADAMDQGGAAGTGGTTSTGGSSTGGTSDSSTAGSGGASGAGASSGGAGGASSGGGGASSDGGGAATGGGGASSDGGGASRDAGGASSEGGASRDGGGGASGAGGSSGDPAAPRPLAVTAAKSRHQHSFRAKTADAAVSFNDNTEVAVVDNRAPTMMGKLVLPFGGVGTNEGTLEAGGEFAARRGFHVIGIAAFQDYDILNSGADFFGQARRSVFEGVMATHAGPFANITLTPADGVAQRTQKALQYLQAQFPDEDWGYYLMPDGSVRWSDVIFSGFSHGGSNSARFAFLVRASRVVSLSAPRENLCTKLDLSNCGGTVATWLSEVPKTPIDRFFAITGKNDDQHLQHLFFMEKTGYVGKATAVDGATPPYGDSHRLIGATAHYDFCQDAKYAAACNYAFGVPSENQAGTQ